MPSTTDRFIADRYALQSSLGSGAMGTVWLAEDLLLKRRVAVKEIDIPPGFDADERVALEARLLREARAAARLSHAGIVSVYDVVEHESRPWIVMEYVDAPTLESRIKQEGPLSASEVARIGIELLNVLEVAHTQGIVHRDVKPGNVMCPADSHVKLADFGIASVQDDPKITQTGMVLGSPSFMSPEQASKGSSGPEGDLWSLGATLYQAVEGEPPFDKGRPLPTLTAVMTEEPRPMVLANELAPIIGALLQKDPSTRPSVAAARAMLEHLLQPDTTIPARVDVTTPGVGSEPSPATFLEPAPPSIPRSSHRTGWGWWPWVVLVLGVAALITVPLLLQNHDQPTSRQQERDGNNRQDSGSSGVVAPSDVRAGWTSYTDPDSGYTVQYPSGWTIVTRAENTLDFTDPVTGSYLRVAWTDAPGDDVMERLREIADAFAAQHANYEELQMAPTEYQGYEAGLWEYAYEDGGVALRAYNLQFVIGDTYGFALNFQTHEADWSGSQELWDSLQATFEPPV